MLGFLKKNAGLIIAIVIFVIAIGAMVMVIGLSSTNIKYLYIGLGILGALTIISELIRNKDFLNNKFNNLYSRIKSSENNSDED